MRRKAVSSIAQLPLFRPEGKWRPTPVSKLPSWESARRVGIDVETCDPQLRKLGPGPRRDGRLVGVSFAIEDGPSFYLPFGHAEDNLDRNEVISYLRDQTRVFGGDLVGANLSYDLDYLLHAGLWFSKVRYYRDVQIADPLINELEVSYSLQNIAKRWGFKGKDEELLAEAALNFGVDKKAGLWALPARYVAPYAMQDADLPLRISRKQERAIEEQDLWNVYNLESRVLPVLVKMRARGLNIDQDKLDEIEDWTVGQEKVALGKIKRHTGIEIPFDGIWKPKLVGAALEAIGVQLTFGKNKQPNVDRHLLDTIDHPVTEDIRWARKVNKLRTTFAASIREHMTNGRIHCVLNQLAREGEDGQGMRGVRYGRLSAEKPNMQQQPARDEFASMWRSIYIPDEGGKWATMDYSQQEPRILTHYAMISGCDKADVAGQRYIDDPNTDNHQMMADLTGIPRKLAKSIYLGLCYNMGGPKFCREVNLPTKKHWLARQGRWIEIAGDEAQDMLDQFDEHAPFVRELGQRAKGAAMSKGFIVTLSGRKCRFPVDALGNYDWVQKALSRLIQGSSADQTKTAMVEVDAAGFDLQLQVHDELDTTVDGYETAADIAEIMRECVKLKVPTKVDIEIGPSWGEATEFCPKCKISKKECPCD